MIPKKTTEPKLHIFNKIPRYLKEKSPPKLQITQPLPPERLPSWPPRCRTNPKWRALSAAAQGAWWWGQQRVQPRPTEAVLTLTLMRKPRLQGSSEVSIGNGERSPFFFTGPQKRHFSATDGPPLCPPSSIASERVGSTTAHNQPHVQVQNHLKVRDLLTLLRLPIRKGLMFTKPIPTTGGKKEAWKLFVLVSQDKVLRVGEFVDGVFSSAKKDKTRSRWEKTSGVKAIRGF